MQPDPKNIDSRKEISPGNYHQRNNHHHQDMVPNFHVHVGMWHKMVQEQKHGQDFSYLYNQRKYHQEQKGLGTTKQT